MAGRTPHPTCPVPVSKPSKDRRHRDGNPGCASSPQQDGKTMPSNQEQRQSEIAKPNGPIASSKAHEPTEALLIREHAKSLSTVTCSACHTSQSLAPPDVTSILQRWSKSHGPIECSRTCTQAACSTVICGGCGRAGWFRESRDVEIDGAIQRISWCCQRGLHFGLWIIACGLLYNVPPPPPDRISRFLTRIRNAKISAYNEFEETYHISEDDGIIPKGVGYSPHCRTFIPNCFWRLPIVRGLRQACNNLAAPQAVWLCIPEAHLRLLTALITVIVTTAEPSEAQIVAVMLPCSPILAEIADILSEESFEAVCQVPSFCDAMMDFVRVLSSSDITATLLSGRGALTAQTRSLLSLSFGVPADESATTTTKHDRSLAEMLKSIATQAQVLVTQAQQHPSDFTDPEGIVTLALARKLCLVQSCCKREAYEQISGDPDAADVTKYAGNTQPAPAMSFSQWHKKFAVDSIEGRYFKMSSQFRLSEFANETCSAASSAPRGRMKRLITEMAALKTSLPEGIFVRHAADRLDLMKVLIIGSRDTPYEHGFFEFDLACPLEYPQKPPLMVFRTTGGGIVRMNPNLYADGTVCLSLLGTWAGEPWKPSQSTLLQLLVSLQAMVLCEKPWYNEPGREQIEDHTKAVEYDFSIRNLTLMHSILPWAELIDIKPRLANKVGATIASYVVTTGCPIRRKSSTGETPHSSSSKQPLSNDSGVAMAADENAMMRPDEKLWLERVSELSRLCWLKTAQLYFDERAKIFADSPWRGVCSTRDSSAVRSPTTIYTSMGAGAGHKHRHGPGIVCSVGNAQMLIVQVLTVKGYLD